MPVTPVLRFTMQDWRESDDCCGTAARGDAEQHRQAGDFLMYPQDVLDYERVIPPLSAFIVGDSVRIRPPASGEPYGITSTGRTGFITETVRAGNGIASDTMVITYDIPDGSFATGHWTPARVEIISSGERVYAPVVSPVELDRELAEMLNGSIRWYNTYTLAMNGNESGMAELRAVNESAIAGLRATIMGANTVRSTAEGSMTSNFTLTPQSEEDTHMNAAQIIEALISNYIARQGDTAKLLLDTKTSRELGVDARAIRRAFKKYSETLSWIDRATVRSIRADKLDGVIKITSDTIWQPSSVGVENLLPTVIPLATALLVLKSTLPEWVDLEADNSDGIIKLSTARGEAFAMALRDNMALRLCGFGSRGVSAEMFTRSISRTRAFREQAARDVFECMKTIARRAIVIRKEPKSSTGNFDNFMSTLRDERESNEIILSRFIIPAHGLVSSRQWGIEVETAGARGVHTPGGWNSKGDSSLDSAYVSDEDEDNECDEDHEAQRYDGRRSYNQQYIPNPDWTDPEECEACIAYNERENNDDGDYRDCREFVSPILHSFHSKGLEKLVEEISTQPQNDTAGIHVHVDVSDLTPKQIGSLVYGYQIIEPLIEASYQRETREYCKPRRNSEVLDVIKQAKQTPTMRNRDFSTDTRYVALNLDSIRAHGTVEFRAMGPVYDYEYLIRWAYFCRELVNVAKADISQGEWNAVNSFEKLAALFIRRGAESVDTQLSTISDDDIAEMIRKNSFDVDESVYATVGGEI